MARTTRRGRKKDKRSGRDLPGSPKAAPKDEAGAPPRYLLKISRLTVDKLGVKLYDKVSHVVAELVSNSYDADATSVQITAPMDTQLASTAGGKLVDKGLVIVVEDNGSGMTPDEVNSFYLKVGAERRRDPKRVTSQKFGRKVMGRKGIGKLAPFGICNRIEVLTSGGEAVSGLDADGKPAKGYLTAHLTLDASKIMSDEDADYSPIPGPLDGRVSASTGTRITMRDFAKRRVPKMQELERQLAQRFGIQGETWQIELHDSSKDPSADDAIIQVGAFEVEADQDTVVTFKPDVPNRLAQGPKGPIQDVQSGLHFEGKFYPIRGWVGYSKKPYRDALMAGVRIYCRGKIAAQTLLFNRKAGFTGEYDVRSYFVGEIYADWIDEEEDLIQTDRRDILWSHELGQALESWGQKLLPIVGELGRAPLKKKSWDLFNEAAKFDAALDVAFPGDDLKPIRTRARDLARTLAQKMRPDEITPSNVRPVANLCLRMAPHVQLDETLRQAAEVASTTVEALGEILKTARIAELSSFGLIAESRVNVITRLELLKDDATTIESQLQKTLEGAPWLIHPEWSPVTFNESFVTFRTEFAKFYKDRTGEDINFTPIPQDDKQADFIMMPQEDAVQIVEIKRPKYKLTNKEMDRIINYADAMDAFLAQSGNERYRRMFEQYHITIVCDELNLSGAQWRTFEAWQKEGRLTHNTWSTFYARTRKVHEDYLKEAKEQRRYVYGP
jgi:hypothetical protein